MPALHIVYSLGRREPRRWCYDCPDPSPIMPLLAGEDVVTVYVDDPSAHSWHHVAQIVGCTVSAPTVAHVHSDATGEHVATISADPDIDTIEGHSLRPAV